MTGREMGATSPGTFSDVFVSPTTCPSADARAWLGVPFDLERDRNRHEWRSSAEQPTAGSEERKGWAVDRLRRSWRRRNLGLSECEPTERHPAPRDLHPDQHGGGSRRRRRHRIPPHGSCQNPLIRRRSAQSRRYRINDLDAGSGSVYALWKNPLWARISFAPPSSWRVGNCVSGQREVAGKCGVFGDVVHRSERGGIPLISLTNRSASLGSSAHGRLSYLSVP